ncbi:MAG: S8 family serine peptidase [Marinicella sp.]|nr:S8 family serine peptidase [Xanthomonadales bacterium]
MAEGNGWFAVELDENGKNEMRGKGGFRNMEVDAKRFLMGYADSAGNPNSVQVYPYNYYQVEGDQLTLQAGQKVCIIDSGIARETGETGGGNLDFDFSVITGNSDSGTGDWFRDGGPHGTHVAGTIGAKDNGFGIIGVAPGVPMHIIKVFNDAGWGYSSDLAQAINLCGAAGANIVNMSLGGGGASSVEENAMDNFVANGGLIFAAAGNDGNDVRSYPAGYKSVVMVGGVNKDDGKYAASQYPSHTKVVGKGRRQTTEDHDGYGVEVSGGGQDVLSTVPAGVGAVASVTADGTGVASSATDNTGTVTAAAYHMGTAEAVDPGAAGKVCIIDRGNISFADKINNCGASGGVGAVVINNVAGDGIIYMDITGVTTSIPAVGTAFEDRSTLVGASTVTVDSVVGDYAVFSGTSMATPTVAGAAALVWSNHPSCTGEEIRAALKESAQDIGDPGRDVHFGYGIVKAAAADAYLTTNGCDGGNEPPPTGEMALSGSRSKGGRQADLSWTGGTTANVDVYINGNLNNTTANDGAVSYNVDKNTSYTFQVCEEGSTTECTNQINL